MIYILSLEQNGRGKQYCMHILNYFLYSICLFWWYEQTNAETILSEWIIELILFGACIITVGKWTYK